MIAIRFSLLLVIGIRICVAELCLGDPPVPAGLCFGAPPVTVEFGGDPRERDAKMENWPRNISGCGGVGLNYSCFRKEGQPEVSFITFSVLREYLTDPLSAKTTYLHFDGAVLNVQEGDTFALINADVRVLSLVKNDKRRARLEVLHEESALTLQEDIGKGFYLCEHSCLKDDAHRFTLGAIERCADDSNQFAVSLSYWDKVFGPPKVSLVKMGDVITMPQYKLLINDISPGDMRTRKRGTIAVEPVLPLATRLPENRFAKPVQK